MLRGGYVGVDVFFVISGFLISSQLIRELDGTGRLRLGAFYARRARRLLPAALLALVVTGVGTLLLLPQRVWEQVTQEIAASAAYVENWVLAADSVNYLAQSENIPSPVQHYWSLSVEEQFYLAWPLLLLLGWWIASRVAVRRGSAPRRRLSIAIILGAVFVGSLTASVVVTHWQPSVAYFATYTRAWEFAAGGLIAVFYRRTESHQVMRGIGSWLGFALIVAATLFFTGATPFPGATALLPVVGAALVIVSGDPDLPWSPRYLVRLRPVQFLGDISYSLYLWHWPILILAPSLLPSASGILDKLALLASAVLLAAVTKRFVEDPARLTQRWRLGRPRVTAAWSAATIAVVVVLALSAGASAAASVASARRVASREATAHARCLGAESLIRSGCAPIANLLIPSTLAAGADDVNTPNCWSTSDVSTLKKCSKGPTTGVRLRVALIGDSHSNQYLAAVEALAQKYRWRVDVYGKTGCIWTAAVQINSPQWVEKCQVWKGHLNAHLARVKPYDVIITSYQATSPIRAAHGKTVRQTTVAGFEAVWKPVTARGTQIVAIRDNPRPRTDYLSCIDYHATDPARACSVSETSALDFFDGQADAAAAVHGAHLLDLTRYFCQSRECSPVIGNVIVYRDATHLTSTYTRTLAPVLRSGILRLTGLRESR